MRPRILIAAVALTMVAAACSGSGSATSTSTTSTSEPVSATATGLTTTSTAATTTLPEPTTFSTAAQTPATEAWGTWTLILASIEAGQTGAEDEAKEIAAGIEEARVLYSGDYPSLNPDYWVVYWGDFESGRVAGNQCGDIPDDLTCYPRYLGPDVSPLAAAGHALVIDGEALVIVDVTSGERLKEFDPYFTGDGMWVGNLSLAPDGTTVYYDVGWEDSWYSCDSSQGQVELLSLEFGTASIVAPGYGPVVSPDGRWLAVLVAGQCLPDPEEPDFWVITPTDTVVLYSLASGWPVEARRWSVASVPVSYDDPRMITWVDWRADSQTLLVANNDGDLFEVPADHQGRLDTDPPVAQSITGRPAALVGDTLYVIRDETPEEWGGFDLIAVDLTTGAEGEVITQTVGWPLLASDTTRTRLIWGSDTQVGTAGSMFSLEIYLGGLAW